MLLGMWLNASGYERRVESRSAGEISLECENPGEWSFDMSISESAGKETITIKMSSDTPQVPPKFTVSMAMPQTDMNYLWSGLNEDRCHLRPDWGANYRTHLSVEMPLYSFLNDNNENRLTIASSEPLRDVNAMMGLREENCLVVASLTYFSVPE
ncbi:MAG: hypothetical protein K2F61_01215, partial [Muribaculaceae bacterium]|nr:hypothetical protein [Muribaculaceae bacterium]